MGEMNNLGFDGTFFVVPKPCYQLWTVHFIVEGHFFPGASVLFMGKTTEMYDSFWEKMQELLPNFNPVSANADFEIAARKSCENHFPEIGINHCLFHYDDAVHRNSQKLGLSKCYENNPQYKTWLKKIMAIPLLPSNLINQAFNELLSENIQFDNLIDFENFCRFKRYVHNQWHRKIRPEHLSCHGLDDCTNNGCECYHAKLKSIIKIHSPSFWHFIYNHNRIQHFYYQQYERLLEWGPDGFVRGPKKSTQNNKSLKRLAEEKLANNVYTWQEFLSALSYISDSLVKRLQQEFKENGDQVLNDDNIYVEPITHDEFICSSCNLNFQQRFMLSCGHSNICGQCIERIQHSNQQNCPTCGIRIENVIQFQ